MLGHKSFISRFLEAQEDGSRRTGEDEMPKAELWFGTHPKGPTLIHVDKQYIRLDSFLKEEPSMIGTVEHYRKYNKTLPYLFKILSVEQPLSLQVHPDKKLASSLHTIDPINYPDSNHKPELAIALTEFEALCDFRPPREILHFMQTLTSFRRLIGGDKNYEHYTTAVKQEKHNSDSQKAALASCFKSLMTSDKETIIKETKTLLAEGSTQIDPHLLKNIKQMATLYPGDPGIFAPFFLNYIKLEPGQAIYLKANKLHAYLHGECIECMACSDNVVRAGLTKKYRDVDTLLGMLDYESVADASQVLLVGEKSKRDPPSTLFAPTDEFKVTKLDISAENAPNRDYTLAPLTSGSFIVVMSGKAKARNFFDLNIEHKLALGSAAYIPPKIGLRLLNIQPPLTIYRAYC